MLYKWNFMPLEALLQKLFKDGLVKSANSEDYISEKAENKQSSIITFFTYVGTAFVFSLIADILNFEKFILDNHYAVNFAIGILSIYALAFAYKKYNSKGDFVDSVAKASLGILVIFSSILAFVGLGEAISKIINSAPTAIMLTVAIFTALFYLPLSNKVLRIVMLNATFYSFLYFLFKDVFDPLFGKDITEEIFKNLVFVLFATSIYLQLAVKKLSNKVYSIVYCIAMPLMYICFTLIAISYYSSYFYIDLYANHIFNIVLAAAVFVTIAKHNSKLVNSNIAISIIVLILTIALAYLLPATICTLLLLGILFYQYRSSHFYVMMVLIPCALVYYYYSLENSLLEKSGILVLSGLVLLAIRFALKYKENKNG